MPVIKALQLESILHPIRKIHIKSTETQGEGIAVVLEHYGLLGVKTIGQPVLVSQRQIFDFKGCKHDVRLIDFLLDF